MLIECSSQQEKKVELKENLIMELEERKKHVEGERNSMELTGSKLLVS